MKPQVRPGKPPRRSFRVEGHAARRVARWFLIVLIAALAGVGCARRRPQARVQFPPPQPAPPRQPPVNLPPAVPGGWTEQGLASWYGVPFHGHRAANGEIYDMYQFTAAHRTLPFNAVVRVTNLNNGLQTEVRINDRGPFVEGRIIDLSLAAARAIDMVGTGVAPVRLEMLSGTNPQAGFFTVQVGAFQLRENADRLRDRLEPLYHTIFIQEYDSPTGVFYRVRVGRLPTPDDARQLAGQLQQEENLVPFVVRLDQ